MRKLPRSQLPRLSLSRYLLRAKSVHVHLDSQSNKLRSPADSLLQDQGQQWVPAGHELKEAVRSERLLKTRKTSSSRPSRPSTDVWEVVQDPDWRI